MNGLAEKKPRAGFTLIEVMIVSALLAVFAVMIFPPLIGAMTNANQQATMTHMDRAADAALNNITSALREAILPVTTLDTSQKRYEKSDFWPTNKKPVVTGFSDGVKEFTEIEEDPDKEPSFAALDFYRVLNSVQGFYATRADTGEEYALSANQISHGHQWRAVLENGVDIVPFTVPVEYRYAPAAEPDSDRLDSSYLPVLGVKLPNGQQFAAAEYLFYKPEDWGNIYNVLGPNPLHPSLQLMPPARFGFTVSRGANDTYKVEDGGLEARVTPGIAFASGEGMHGFAIMRFVADSPSGKENGLLRLYGENLALSREEAFGQNPAEYLSGHIEIAYVVDNAVLLTRALTPNNTILLQTAPGDAEKPPLFRLVRTSNSKKDEEADKHIGHTIEVNLLLYDYNAQVGQRTTFKAKSAMTNLIRSYKTKVQLRNMARR